MFKSCTGSTCGRVSKSKLLENRSNSSSKECAKAPNDFESFQEVSLSKSFGAFAHSLDELFERFSSNFDLLTRPHVEPVQDLNIEVTLTSEEAKSGGSVCILVPARAICPTCGGHGAVGFYECWRCHGQGSITAEYPLQVSYPAALRRDYVVHVPLDDLGIQHLYLTIKFRPTPP